MTWAYILLLAVAVFGFVMFATPRLADQLTRRGVLDYPNARSSHTTPTARGGGIVVLTGLILAWLFIGWREPTMLVPILVVIASALVLAAISWVDDLRSLPALPRLAAQAVAVFVVLSIAPLPGPVFGGLLPAPLDGLATGLLWIWFINLYNFMDGIDGIATVEATAIGFGIAAAGKIAGLALTLPALGLSLGAACLGFLRWNWHPARIFLGDVGSVPLGFVIGWLLLWLAAEGEWAPALILPLYFLADATWTLVRRATTGASIWVAHKDHLYQLAFRRGLRHDQITGIVLISDLFLVALACVAARGQISAALIGAFACVGLLLFFLAKADPPLGPPAP